MMTEHTDQAASTKLVDGAGIPFTNQAGQYQFPELFMEHVKLLFAGPAIGRSRETLSQTAQEARHWVEFVGAV
jgi:hypothetical protein